MTSSIEELRQRMATLKGQKAAIESQMEEVGERLGHEVAVAYLAQSPETKRTAWQQQQPSQKNEFDDWGLPRND